MSIATLKSYWDVMQPEDAQVVALSFLATLVLGCAVVGGFVLFAFRWDAKKTAERIRAEGDKVENALAARAARQGRPYVPKKSVPAVGTKAANKAVPPAPRDVKVRAPLPKPVEKRHLPAESQAALVENGRQQLADDKPDKALVTYLTLLYSAAENRDGSALPSNLTECLRGAAECYRKLGQPENAVKFLQAERRVFEEVVVSAANANRTPEEKKRAGGILSSLLNPGVAGATEEEDLPRRCQTLSDVAEACSKLGRHDVALAYRVKAAAVKQKVTGKQLDERSPELLAMASSLAKLRELGLDTEKAVREATSGEHALRRDDPLLKAVLSGPKSSEATAASAGPPSDTPPADE